MSGRTDLARVGVAVVGLGYWGPNLVRNLYELPEAQVVCVCDLEVELLRAIGERYPTVPATTRYAEVLANPAVEAVALATPVSTHHELALAALRAGKHVFVEKPLAPSAAAASELVATAEDTSLVLMPGHTFLYSPPVNLVRDLIDSGELGQIYSISTSRVNLGLHQPDVSVVWDLGPHDFSILRYWLGVLPKSVSALCRGCVLPDAPDVAFVHLAYESGTIAHAELSWLAPSKLRRTTVIGSEKMVVYDDTSAEPVRIFDSGVMLDDPQTFGEYRLSYRTGAIVSPPVDAAEPLSLELRDFCRAIRLGTEPRSSARLGLDIVVMTEAVERSLSTRGSVVELDVPSSYGLQVA